GNHEGSGGQRLFRNFQRMLQSGGDEKDRSVTRLSGHCRHQARHESTRGSHCRKAHNPSLKLDVINARLQHPTAPQGTFVKVPEWVIAHSVRAGSPNSFYQPDGSAESIGLEFTTPPNPPLVSKVARYVQFPSGKPVLLGTLLDALHKKYGPENFALNGNLVWVFDANGKQLTRFLTQAEKGCDPGNYVWDFPGQDIRGVSGSDGAISLTENEMEEFNVRYERHLACTPLTFVVATNLDLPPNSPVTQMMVVILSPALL